MQRSLRIILYWTTQLSWLCRIWRKIRRMIRIKRFPTASSVSPNLRCIKTYLRQCLIIIESYFGWKRSNRSWSRRPGKGDFQFLKCCHPRRGSWRRKQRKWEISIVGLYSSINQSGPKLTNIRRASCNSSLKYSLIRKKIDISMKLWWSFPAKCSSLHLKERIFQSLKKRLIDYSDQMLLIFQLDSSLMNHERKNIHHWKRLRQMKALT